MRRYETISIIKSSVGENEITDIVDKASSIITADGGTILKIDRWGIKKLAYPIKKDPQGYYVYMDYASAPAAVAEMERIFKIDDRLLKYMTVKLADSCDPAALLEEIAAQAAKTAETTETADSEQTENSDDDSIKDDEVDDDD